jgi:hypothetical protein
MATFTSELRSDGPIGNRSAGCHPAPQRFLRLNDLVGEG